MFGNEGIQVDDEQVVEITRAPRIPAEDVESSAVQADGETPARWDLVTADFFPLVSRRSGIEHRKMVHRNEFALSIPSSQSVDPPGKSKGARKSSLFKRKGEKDRMYERRKIIGTVEMNCRISIGHNSHKDSEMCDGKVKL